MKALFVITTLFKMTALIRTMLIDAAFVIALFVIAFLIIPLRCVVVRAAEAPWVPMTIIAVPVDVTRAISVVDIGPPVIAPLVAPLLIDAPVQAV